MCAMFRKLRKVHFRLSGFQWTGHLALSPGGQKFKYKSGLLSLRIDYRFGTCSQHLLFGLNLVKRPMLSRGCVDDGFLIRMISNSRKPGLVQVHRVRDWWLERAV